MATKLKLALPASVTENDTRSKKLRLALPEMPKNNGGLAGGLEYIGASALAGVGGVFEGTFDLIGGGIAALTGDKAYAEYLFKNNVVGDWHKRIEDGYNPNKAVKFVADASSGVGQSATMLIPYVGVPLFFAGAMGQSTSGAVEKTGKLGFKEVAYGTLAGAAEGALEVVVGGAGSLLSSVGSKAGKSITVKLVPQIVKDWAATAAWKGVVNGMVTSATGEFFEEFLSEYVDTALQRMTGVDKEASTTFGQALYSGLVGFASGLALGGIATGINSSFAYSTGRRVADAGNADALVNTADKILANLKVDEKGEGIQNKNFKNLVVQLGESLNNYRTATNKGSDAALIYLGEIKSYLASVETLQAVQIESAKLAGMTEAQAKGYAVFMSNVDGRAEVSKNYTAEDWYKNTNEIRDRYAAMQWAGAYMSDSKAQIESAAFDEAIKADIEGREVGAPAIADIADAEWDGADATYYVGADKNGAKGDPNGNYMRIAKGADGGYYMAVGNNAAEVRGARRRTENEARELFNQYRSAIIEARQKNASQAEISAQAERARAQVEAMNAPGSFATKSDKAAVQRLAEKLTAQEAATRSEVENATSALDEEINTPAELGENVYSKEDMSRARKAMRNFDLYDADTKSRVLRWIKSTEGKNIDADVASAVANIMRIRKGLQVILADLGEGKLGLYTEVEAAERNLIVVPGSNDKSIVRETIAHELFHEVENQPGAEEIKNAAFKATKEEQRKEYKELYKKKFPKMTKEELDNEVAAKIVGRRLATPRFLERYADKSFLQRVIDGGRAMLETFRADEAGKLAIAETEKLIKMMDEAIINGNVRVSGKSAGKTRYLFAGEKADTADKMRLATAEKMLSNGVDPERVRQETGWFKGYDGKWRFEIDDFDSALVENPKLERHEDDGEIYFTGKLTDIFDHPELYEAYPELKDINIVIQKTDWGVDAIYQPRSNYITLSQEQFKRYTKEYYDYLNGGRKAEIERIEQTPEFLEYNKWYEDEITDNMDPVEWLKGEAEARQKFFSSELGKTYHRLKYTKDSFTGEKFELGWGKEAKAVILHELQHAVQNIEGFASGTNTRDKNYDRNAGEIEAFDTGRRADLTAEQRKNTRPDIDRADVVIEKNTSDSFLYIGDTKDGRRCYKSGFDSSVDMNERIRLFKERIATIFNLGAVELKTDIKKIKIKGDRFTSQKNIYGDKYNRQIEQDAKVSSLYDLADILATSKYEPAATKPEPSYVNSNVKPKNAAHKNVKYWYKFVNNIVFDGVPYEVTFNIRDKGTEQYQYLIEFKENKTPGLSNTAVKNLLRTGQASYNNSIPQVTEKSTPTAKKSYNLSPDAKKVDAITQEDIQKLEKHFGTTNNFDVAGYLLVDGKMLDFSGKHWGDDYSTSRTVDHRDVLEGFNYEGVHNGNNGVKAMVDMIGSGNIRLAPESGGINIAVAPNDTQIWKLTEYIRHFRGEVVVDIDAVGGDTIHTFTYNKGTAPMAVIRDIMEYFENGTIPQPQPDYRQFRYNLSPETESHAAQDAAEVNQRLVDEALNARADMEYAWEQMERANKESDAARAEAERADFKRQVQHNETVARERNARWFKWSEIEPEIRSLAKSYKIKGKEARDIALTVHGSFNAFNGVKKESRDNMINSLVDLIIERADAAENSDGRWRDERREQLYKRLNEIYDATAKKTERQKARERVENAEEMAWRAVNGSAIAPLLDRVKMRRFREKASGILSQEPYKNLVSLARKIRPKYQINLDNATEFLKYFNEFAQKFASEAVVLAADSESDAKRQLYNEARGSNEVLRYIDARLAGALADFAERESGDWIEDDYDTLRLALERLLAMDSRFDKQFNTDGTFGETSKVAADVLGDLDKKYGGELSTMNKGGVLGGIQTLVYNSLEPEAAVRLAEGATGRHILTRMVNAIKYAAEMAKSDERKWLEEIEKFKKDNKKWWSEWNEGDVNFAYTLPTFDGKTKTNSLVMTKDEAASLYMTSKRAQAQAALALGRVELADAIGRKGEQYRSRVIDGLTDSQIDELIGMDQANREGFIIKCEQSMSAAVKDMYSQFSETDRKYIALLEKFYATTSKTEKRNMDFRLYGSTNVFEGYYYPISRSSLNRDLDLSSTYRDLDDVSTRGYTFNKSTIEGARSRLTIRGATEVTSRHARQLAMYKHLSMPLQNFQRVYNYKSGENVRGAKSVRDYMTKYVWKEADKYFGDYFQDVQGMSRRTSNDAVSRGVRKLQSGYVKFQLGANLKSLIKQFGSAIGMSSVVDLDVWAKGVYHAKIFSKDAKADMIKYSKVAANRVDSNEVYYAAGVSGSVDKISDALMKHLEWGDTRANLIMWAMAQQAVAKETNHTVGSEENKRLAGKKLDEFILQVQDTSGAATKSAYARIPQVLVQGFTMFTSAPTKLFSRFYVAASEFRELTRLLKTEGLNETDKKRYNELKEKSGKMLGKAAGAILAGAVFEAVVNLAWSGLKGDDDEEDKKFIQKLATETLVNAAGIVPMAGTAIESLISGYDVSNLYIDIYNDGLGAMRNLYTMTANLASGEQVSEQDVLRNLRSVAYFGGQLSGIPLRNINTMVTMSLNTFSKEAAYKYDALFYEPSYASDLKKALNSGNAKLVEGIVGLTLKERTGTSSTFASDEVIRLVSAGYDVLPKTAPSKVTIDGEERNVSRREHEAFDKIYSEADSAVIALMATEQYSEVPDELRAKAIRVMYDIYHSRAKSEVLGAEISAMGALSYFDGYIDVPTLVAESAYIYGIQKADDATRAELIRSYISGYSPEAQAILLYAAGYRSEAVKEVLTELYTELDEKTQEIVKNRLEF